VAIRAALFLVAVLTALLYLAPTFLFDDAEKPPSWWPGFFPQEKMRLGLDLQGGSHLVLEVKVEKAGPLKMPLKGCALSWSISCASAASPARRWKKA
jgi:preprotein translocase subunit SecD